MMAWQLKNTIKLTSNPGLQTTDFMPWRRKRYYGKMSLMLLIFVSCCLTLISSPLHVQANELNNTTSKGENMLSNDLQSHQHKEGETTINTDKTDDDGIFKRLQTATANKMENEHSLAEQEDEEEDEDEHSTEVIEMIQPTHTLRHQEHYKQRILLAGKHKQQNQHLDGNGNAKIDGADADGDAAAEGDGDLEVVQERELSQYNRNLRYQQIQQALREPIASTAAHHRRHEHHLAMKQQRWAKQAELTWPPQQHHLRHQHHQHQQTQELQRQPQLRHLKHEMRKQNITNTRIKPLLHQRYFDRESAYIYPMTTEGPHVKHSDLNSHWKPVANSNNPHNRLYSDEGHNNPKEEDIKRFSLPLHGHEIENAKRDKHTLQANTSNDDDDDDDDDKDDDSIDSASNDDDYSYEDDEADDDNDHKEINKPNNYPSLTSHTKTNVKRYTNPLKSLHKPSYSSARQPTAGHHLRHTPAHDMNAFKASSNNDNDNNNNNNKYNDEYDDDIEKNEDDVENSSGTSAENLAGEDEDGDGDDDKMSDEKWNKIEHEHYRKQLQHQRAMQALRYRRPQNDNTQQHTSAAAAAAASAPITATIHNNNNNSNNKYVSYSPSSLSAASTNNAAWKKRQTINEDDGDNIYSRYYVSGSVTRKKEEELGSPTAILESRRQFALQQRQNKALASAHHRRIVTEGFCRLPQPRVERIRRDSWKIYTPHCTILHRCADDAGCCPSERQTCAPKRTKNVDLYFFVISLNETQGSIEKLTFVNHTECHCINRSKQRAPEYASAAAKDLMAFNNQIPYLRRATILNCFCPNLFEKILQEDGFCRCDCSSGNMGCDWLKRGMEHFSMNDRKCIIEGRCKLPTCEYGQYIKKHGRCPRREERHLSADIDW